MEIVFTDKQSEGVPIQLPDKMRKVRGAPITCEKIITAACAQYGYNREHTYLVDDAGVVNNRTRLVDSLVGKAFVKISPPD